MDKKTELFVLLDSLMQQRTSLFHDYKSGKIYRRIIDAIDKELIEKALCVSFGNQRRAAKLLGINRNTLHAKICRLNIKVARFKA